MSIDWDEVQKALSPIKDFDDLRSRLRVSFSYAFIVQIFNFTLPELVGYTHNLLGGDSRGRYIDYEARLIRTFNELSRAGIANILELKDIAATHPQLELFVQQSGISPLDIVSVLKYLIYWFIPGEKYMSGLVRSGSNLLPAIKTLSGLGIRTNLQLLQNGISPSQRESLVANSGFPAATITQLVNIADFSRLPWASKATIANFIGAGYTSLAKLANADPEQLYADFFRYGKSIGKNLKLGNEIESSYRVAKIVPTILQENEG